MAITTDAEMNSSTTCMQPFPQQMDPPPTMTDIVMKDVTPPPSNERVSSFLVFNYSLLL